MVLAEGPTRRAEVLAAARRLLEEGGSGALTMRALGQAVGMRAPSLYKHFPDKGAVERGLVEVGLRELVGALDVALAAFAEPLPAFAAAYRAWATAHPHLYRLVAERWLDRGPAARIERATSLAQPLLSAAGGDAALARALWGLCHGLALLEIGGRVPRAATTTDRAWVSGVAALSEAVGAADATDTTRAELSEEEATWTGSAT
jgi:AcrR family transcriptional regulator